MPCPFYGSRWPDRSPKLEKSAKNECGLDVDRGHPCEMEQRGKPIDYFSCPVVAKNKAILDATDHLIELAGESTPMTLRQWKDLRG